LDHFDEPATIPPYEIIDQALPLQSQPPNPCSLLTEAQLATTFGGHVEGAPQETDATASKPVRGCNWSLASGGSDGGGVLLVTMSAAGDTAARAAYRTAGLDDGNVLPLAIVFRQRHLISCTSCTQFASLKVLGYPGQYLANPNEAMVSISTPTALVGLYVPAKGEATVIGLAESALRGLNAICPCGHEDTGAPDPVLPMASQPPNPCQLLTTQEVTTTIGAPLLVSPPPPLAENETGARTCNWNDWSAGRARGSLYVTITTTASFAAAKGARASAASLRDLFARRLGPPGAQPIEDARIGGYPAHVAQRMAWLQVLTPKALITVGADTLGVGQRNPATLTRLAELALGRINSAAP
jgi:hypothetical protein